MLFFFNLASKEPKYKVSPKSELVKKNFVTLGLELLLIVFAQKCMKESHCALYLWNRVAFILILRFLFGLTPQIFKFWDEKNACKFLAWSDYFWTGARRSKSSGFEKFRGFQFISQKLLDLEQQMILGPLLFFKYATFF